MAGQADSLKIMLFALFANAATLVTGNLPWDAIATISIGMLLLTACSHFEPDVEH